MMNPAFDCGIFLFMARLLGSSVVIVLKTIYNYKHYIMKRTMMTTAMAVLAVTVSALAGTPVKYDRLPEAARNFIAKNITETNAVEIEKDSSHGRVVYEVTFADGTDMEFDSAGRWIKYEAPDGYAVPAYMIPPRISKYVRSNYPDRVIGEIERTPKGYKVEVTGDMDLYFTRTEADMVRSL